MLMSLMLRGKRKDLKKYVHQVGMKSLSYRQSSAVALGTFSFLIDPNRNKKKRHDNSPRKISLIKIEFLYNKKTDKS